MDSKTEKKETTVFGLRYENGLKIAMAYEENHVQYLKYEKFVELTSKPNDTRVLEHFIEPSNGAGGKGQLLGIYDKNNLKFILVRGITGRIIRRNEDVVYRWEFPLNKADLDIYLNLAQYEISHREVLEEKISTFGSHVEYEIKINC